VETKILPTASGKKKLKMVKNGLRESGDKNPGKILRKKMRGQELFVQQIIVFFFAKIRHM
jgi:hypothetical protein